MDNYSVVSKASETHDVAFHENVSWTQLSIKEKLGVLENIAQSVFGQITRSINKDFAIKAHPAVHLENYSFRETGGHTDGSQIFISEKALNDYEHAFGIIVHEAAHVAQFAIKDYCLKTSQMDQLCTLLNTSISDINYVYNRNFFGIQLPSTSSYISPVIGHGNEEYNYLLRQALYKTQLIERQAFQYEEEILRSLGYDREANVVSNDMTFALNVIKDRYYCRDWTNEAIYAALDNALECVVLNQMPKTAIEASMAYDIAAMLNIQTLAPKMTQSKLREYASSLTEPSAKSNALFAYGYTSCLTIPESQLHNYIGFHAYFKDAIKLQNPQICFLVWAQSRPSAQMRCDLVAAYTWLSDTNSSFKNNILLAIAQKENLHGSLQEIEYGVKSMLCEDAKKQYESCERGEVNGHIPHSLLLKDIPVRPNGMMADGKIKEIQTALNSKTIIQHADIQSNNAELDFQEIEHR